MKRIILTAIISIAVLATFYISAYAQSPLDGLSQLKDYTAMRKSSADPDFNGNTDSRSIAPGQTFTLAELKGPGRIAHIWCTIADKEKYYGKMLVLRIYWDGEKNPSVECPINDFFCEGHGLDMTVNSLPIRVSSDGKGRNCYFPMPFAKSAKITVTNDGKESCYAFYYYVDWQKMSKLDKKEAYFHASYRQEYPCVSGKDYLILDAIGHGQYVGCNLSIRQSEPGWWGEGDDRFYIDGEKTPSIQGTGTEDYFCDGWGIRKLDGLFYGFPITEGDKTFARHTCYRFHLQDPVPFTKSLKVEIEHRGVRLVNGNWVYVERGDDYSSVAYWYQTEPHKPLPPMPSADKRLYYPTEIVFECEDMMKDAVASVDAVAKQDIWSCSGNAQLFFNPKESPASIAFKLNVPKSGKYEVVVAFTKSFDYGIYQAYLDSNPVGSPKDLYNPTVMQTQISLGMHDLNQGIHDLKFMTNAKNPSSDGFYLGIDSILLYPMKP